MGEIILFSSKEEITALSEKTSGKLAENIELQYLADQLVAKSNAEYRAWIFGGLSAFTAGIGIFGVASRRKRNNDSTPAPAP